MSLASSVGLTNGSKQPRSSSLEQSASTCAPAGDKATARFADLGAELTTALGTELPTVELVAWPAPFSEECSRFPHAASSSKAKTPPQRPTSSLLHTHQILNSKSLFAWDNPTALSSRLVTIASNTLPGRACVRARRASGRVPSRASPRVRTSPAAVAPAPAMAWERRLPAQPLAAQLALLATHYSQAAPSP